MLVTPNFHMNGQCKNAIKLYEQAFGATVHTLLCNSDANPADHQTTTDEADFVYHAVISIGGQRIMMTDDLSDFPPKGNTLSLLLTFDTPDQVKAAYALLSEGCTLITPMTSTTYCACFVSLIDRYGVRWELMTEE